jgi:hypothetical protein
LTVKPTQNPVKSTLDTSGIPVYYALRFFFNN